MELGKARAHGTSEKPSRLGSGNLAPTCNVGTSPFNSPPWALGTPVPTNCMAGPSGPSCQQQRIEGTPSSWPKMPQMQAYPPGLLPALGLGLTGTNLLQATAPGCPKPLAAPVESGMPQLDALYRMYYGQHAPFGSYAPGFHPRVALPNSAEEPVYVNAKQYHCILRRRQQRAKAEQENKLLRARKPYLHESRHNHATRRVRGAGGRFLNAEEARRVLEKRKASEMSKGEDDGDGSSSSRGGDVGAPYHEPKPDNVQAANSGKVTKGGGDSCAESGEETRDGSQQVNRRSEASSNGSDSRACEEDAAQPGTPHRDGNTNSDSNHETTFKSARKSGAVPG